LAHATQTIINKNQEESEFDKLQESILRTQRVSRAFPHLALVGFVITLLSLLLLGIHFFVFSMSIFFAILLLSPVWNPAMKFFLLVTGLRESESHIPNKNHQYGRKSYSSF
jgi:Zn-dependent membrane protease YugP